MSEVLEKRTADSRTYDVDCSRLLAPGQLVTSVGTPVADQGGVTFGSWAPTGSPTTYPDGRVVAAGRVIRGLISGGTIPAGRPYLDCTLRFALVAPPDPSVEATVVLRLIDNLLSC